MKSYIFITTEGSTTQPNSESFGHDIENCQVIGFGKGNDVQEAFENTLKEYPYLLKTTFDEVIALELKDDERIYFYLNFYKDRAEKKKIQEL